MKKIRILPLFVLLCWAVAALYGNDIVILIDGSASMKGFAETRSLGQTVTAMQNAIGEAGLSHEITMFFSGRDREKTSYLDISSPHDLLPDKFAGMTTVLDRPFIEHSKEHKAVILITDNVDNSSGEADTERFYKSIQNTQEMRQLSVIPLIAPFNGNPYVGNNANYNGDRGMMAYLVIYDDDYTRYSALRDKLKNQGFELLHFYPITADHLRIDSDGDKNTEYTMFSLNHKYILSRNQKMQLVKAIVTGQPNDITFSFGLSSKYEHFYLKRDTRVKIVNLQIRTDRGDRIPIKASWKINPEKLVKDMNPDGVKQFFVGTIRILPEPKLRQEISMLIYRPNLMISFDILLEAQENGLSLTTEFEEAFFTENPQVLDKIFSKQDLLSIINPYSNKIVLPVQNLNKKNSPETTISIRPGRENSIIFGAILLLFVIGIGVYLLNTYLQVKTIVLFHDDQEIRVRAHASYRAGAFIIRNKTRVELMINDHNWRVSTQSKSSSKVNIVAGVNYELHNEDYSQTTSIRYINT